MAKRGATPTVRQIGNGVQFIQCQLRVSPDLYEAIKAKASESSRSFNAEVIQRLSDSLGMVVETAAPQATQLLQEIADHLRQIRANTEPVKVTASFGDRLRNQ